MTDVETWASKLDANKIRVLIQPSIKKHSRN